MTSKWKSIRNSTFCKSQFNYSRIKRLVLDLTLISMDHFQAFVFYSNVEESLNEISTFVNQSRSWCSQWSQLTVYLVCVNASHFQPLSLGLLHTWNYEFANGVHYCDPIPALLECVLILLYQIDKKFFRSIICSHGQALGRRVERPTLYAKLNI